MSVHPTPGSKAGGWLVRSLGLTAVMAACLAASGSPAASAVHGPAWTIPSPTPPPFRLPFADPPGPSTWLLIQPYGNTVFAYRFRTSMYVAGQGLHFGVDLAAACGTPVLAVGDGVVAEVDSAAHGAGPHNLMIDHANGYASFYGHLLKRPALRPGLPVQMGQPVALSGDPDGTCTSRPHLHLEIRNAPSHRIAYNPMPLIAADWPRIALAGAAPIPFEQDLAEPRRWQDVLDQPDVTFGGTLLNDYRSAWPPPR